LANLHSAQKRIRSNERKRVQNRIIRSRARTAIHTARTSLAESNGMEAVKKAASELDRAVTKGVIHKNNAARRKSRLMKQLRSVAKTSPSK
jgi:small subunit ribosomal protein S20